jgi:hypothetical protein
VAALEYAAGVEAVVVGKPAPAFFLLALSQLGVEAQHAAMVGDDVESDVIGAIRAGMRGVLVRTGKFREDVAAAADPPPSATIDSIAEAAGAARRDADRKVTDAASPPSGRRRARPAAPPRRRRAAPPHAPGICRSAGRSPMPVYRDGPASLDAATGDRGPRG